MFRDTYEKMRFFLSDDILNCKRVEKCRILLKTAMKSKNRKGKKKSKEGWYGMIDGAEIVLTKPSIARYKQITSEDQ